MATKSSRNGLETLSRTLSMGLRSKFQILLLAITLSISGCSALAPRSADDALAQKLVGTWAGEYAESGYLTSYGEKTYYADGHATGFIVFPANANAGACTALRKLSYESKWQVVDGVLVITDVVYTPSSLNDGK